MKAKTGYILLAGCGCLIILFLVVFLLGVLGVAVAPSFVNLTKQASQTQFQGMVGAVKSGINLSYAQALAETGNATFPATLDDEPEGPCGNCFSKVLPDPVRDKNWTKTGPLSYAYRNGAYSASFTYDPASGDLIE